MLQSIHVRNLALMEETEVEFTPGLNILTGETGAGKSLLIGSVTLALGGKFSPEMLRHGADSALVELSFSVEDREVVELLASMDIDVEEGNIVISRKCQVGKSVFRINGETVTAKQIKELAELLLDIHGQHEHQSLLHKKKHMEILDGYCGEAILEPLDRARSCFEALKTLKAKLEEEQLDDRARDREQSLAEFELKEIEEAELKEGEDEELEQRYRLMVNSRKIMENLSECHTYTGMDSELGAADALGRALHCLKAISGYDGRLAELESQLEEIDQLLNDFNRDTADYMNGCNYDEETFREVESRLNLINHLKDKYGNSIEAILKTADERREYLEKLADYDGYIQGLQLDIAAEQKRLEETCGEINRIRCANAAGLEKLLIEALQGLNFLDVRFEISITPDQTPSAKGSDDVEFMISTNPGESLKPLGLTASGGELSRIMLAIKTVMAKKDSIDTLIFDEIDAGISGRTAWKVAEQLAGVARSHQVLCITHLPQIAAMADSHYVIEKSSDNDSTITDIREIQDDDSVVELARLLGSDAATEAAITNAREMQKQARDYKAKL